MEWSALRKEEAVSIVVFLFLIVLLLLGIREGYWPLSSALEYVPYFIMAGMIGVLLWGFRQRIDKAFKRNEKPRKSREKKRREFGDPRNPVFIQKRLQLYTKIGEDLVRIRMELNETASPIDILFPSWNEPVYFVDFDQRDALIGDEATQRALQHLSSAINRRNDRRIELLKGGWDFSFNSAYNDPWFIELNEICVEACSKVADLSQFKSLSQERR
jgi:hypothetical protein